MAQRRTGNWPLAELSEDGICMIMYIYSLCWGQYIDLFKALLDMVRWFSYDTANI